MSDNLGPLTAFSMYPGCYFILRDGSRCIFIRYGVTTPNILWGAYAQTVRQGSNPLVFNTREVRGVAPPDAESVAILELGQVRGLARDQT